MIFEPGGHAHDPQNQLLLTLALHNYLKNKKSVSQIILKNNLFGEVARSQKSSIFEKTCSAFVRLKL